jgi:hypothetical protein
MRMVLKLRSPGVEDCEETDGGGAEESRVGGELLQCSVGTGEDGGIAGTLVAADEALEGFGERNGDEEVVTRQEFLELFVEPLFGFVELACRTVAVAAGAGKDMVGTALITSVNGGAVGAAATVLESVDDLFVFRGHTISVPMEVLGSVGSEDFLNGAHESIPCINCATR